MKTMKKDNIKLLATIGIAILLLGIVIFFNQQEIIITASIGDHSDTIKRSTASMKSQSFFNQEANIFFLQSTKPLEEGDEGLYLEMKIINTYPEYVELLNADIYKNGAFIETKRFNAPINTGGTFLFVTKDIDLGGGEKAVKNKLQIFFKLKGTSGKHYEQIFTYYYYPLTSCNSNNDCYYPTIMCDKYNQAGFGNNYCVRVCADNADCPQGQVCKLGVCAK